MELRIGLGRREPVLSSQPRVGEVHRVVKACAPWVRADHFQIIADGSRSQHAVWLLPRHLYRDLGNVQKIEIGGQEWIERKYAQLTAGRGRRLRAEDDGCRRGCARRFR